MNMRHLRPDECFNSFLVYGILNLALTVDSNTPLEILLRFV